MLKHKGHCNSARAMSVARFLADCQTVSNFEWVAMDLLNCYFRVSSYQTDGRGLEGLGGKGICKKVRFAAVVVPKLCMHYRHEPCGWLVYAYARKLSWSIRCRKIDLLLVLCGGCGIRKHAGLGIVYRKS